MPLLLGAAVAGLVVGTLTAYGQGLLGDEIGPLANSATPWAFAAFLVARRAPNIRIGALSAVVTLWWCELGYAIATEVRGGSNEVTTVGYWLAAGTLAGPPLGVAAVWSTRADWRRGTGIGVIAGVAIGEAWYGWTTLGATTEWRYWAAELIVGLAAAGVAASRARSRHDRPMVLVAAGVTSVVVLTVARGG